MLDIGFFPLEFALTRRWMAPAIWPELQTAASRGPVLPSPDQFSIFGRQHPGAATPSTIVR
jgi:hypothetical protein